MGRDSHARSRKTMPDYYVPWSEREGLSEVRSQLQDSDMDEALRMDLWNAFYTDIAPWGGEPDMLRDMWLKVLHMPVDEMPAWQGIRAHVRRVILDGDWRLACDALVFAAEAFPKGMAARFTQKANEAFDRGKFAWRFSGRKLVRRMGNAEIKAIEAALDDSQPFAEVRKQLDAALDEFSSRENANYGHAAKEAISAVESLVKRLTGDPKVTLGEGLSRIKDSGKPKVHGALLSSFSSLYGYASDKGYVRHAAKPDDLTDVTLEEAQLVLVSCSAIVSFLIARAGSEGMLE